MLAIHRLPRTLSALPSRSTALTRALPGLQQVLQPLTFPSPPLRQLSAARKSSNVARVRGTPHLKRKLGQHLLVSDEILDRIVVAAKLPELLDVNKQSSGEDAKLRVLEIGPGTGNLTSALLNAAPQVHVHAVEFDARMVERLQERFGDDEGEVKSLAGADGAVVTRISDRLTVEQGDFEQFEFSKASEEDEQGFDACVANIPYQLSSIIVSRLTTYMHRYPSTMRCAVLLVQEEFARRLLARPGEQNYSRLSVNTALIADVESVVPVPRGLFMPPPKVDSRVIKLTPRDDASDSGSGNSLLREFESLTSDPLFFQRFDALLRVCFLRKNKTLRALLTSRSARVVYDLDSSLLPHAADDDGRVTVACEKALEACALTASRAVQVPVSQFLMLQHELKVRGVTLRPSDTRHFRD